jgi:hypothetical protein
MPRAVTGGDRQPHVHVMNAAQLRQQTTNNESERWSPGDGDSLACVGVALEQVCDRDRVVLCADLARAACVDEQPIAAKSVAGGSLTGMDERSRADEGPVEVLDGAVDVQRVGVLRGLRLPFFGEVGGVSSSRVPGATSRLPAPPTITSGRTPARRTPSISERATSSSV